MQDIVTLRELTWEFGVGLAWLRKDLQECNILVIGTGKHANTTLSQANLYRRYFGYRAVQEASRRRKAHNRREIAKLQMALELWPETA